MRSLPLSLEIGENKLCLKKTINIPEIPVRPAINRKNSKISQNPFRATTGTKTMTQGRFRSVRTQKGGINKKTPVKGVFQCRGDLYGRPKKIRGLPRATVKVAPTFYHVLNCATNSLSRVDCPLISSLAAALSCAVAEFC